MLDRISSVASQSSPAMDVVGKLSVRALDSLPLPLLIILFLACLALINYPLSNQSVLPTHSPSLDKDRLSPYSPFPPSRSPVPPSRSPPTHSTAMFNTGVFGGSPQYVAVVATGRRSSRFRDWRGNSLDAVEELDEKRDDLC